MTNAADIFVGEAIRDNIVRPWMGDRNRSATMAMADLRQVWLGSVPSELDEEELTVLLGRHGIKPYKIILRQRPGQEPLCTMLLFVVASWCMCTCIDGLLDAFMSMWTCIIDFRTYEYAIEAQLVHQMYIKM